MNEWLKHHLVAIAVILIFARFLPCFSILKRRSSHRLHNAAKPGEAEENLFDKRLTFAVSSIVCLVAIFALNDAADNVNQNTQQSRKAAAFEFVRRNREKHAWESFNNLLFKVKKEVEGETNQNGRNVKINSLISRRLTNAIASTTNMDEATRLVLADCEIMAVEIKAGQADEDIVYYLMSRSLVDYRAELSDYIEAQRKDQKSGTNLWIEFDDLIRSWSKQTSIVTKKQYDGYDYFKWVENGNSH